MANNEKNAKNCKTASGEFRNGKFKRNKGWEARVEWCNEIKAKEGSGVETLVGNKKKGSLLHKYF